jgi:hypothetical protein
LRDSIPVGGGVALAPHDAAALAMNGLVIHGVHGTLGIGGALEVDVGVTKRVVGDGIAAHTHGDHGANAIEEIEELGLGDLGGKFTNPEEAGLDGASSGIGCNCSSHVDLCRLKN